MPAGTQGYSYIATEAIIPDSWQQCESPQHKMLNTETDFIIHVAELIPCLAWSFSTTTNQFSFLKMLEVMWQLR